LTRTDVAATFRESGFTTTSRTGRESAPESLNPSRTTSTQTGGLAHHERNEAQ